MKYNYTFEQFKKLYIASLLMIGALIFGQVNGPALEMTAGSGNTVANGPTTVAQTIFFQNNTDNTGAGTTFTTYAPTLSATYAISNIRSGNVINFGQTTTGAVPIFELMNAQGAPADANFTSAGAAVGTGIVGATNRAVRLYVQTLPLRTANRPTNSTTDIADLTITFNRPVNNPVIHIGGLGGTSNTTPVLGFSGVLDLTSFVGTNVSLTRLSGNGTTSFQSTSTSISNGSTTFTSTGANSGSGSVRVNGTGITSLTFKIAIKGDGANTAVTAWSPNSDAAVGEAFSVGFSTLESDIQVTKTMANTTAAVGANTTFTVTATNNGPSNNANINITDVLPTGYSLNGTATTTVGTYTSGTGVWNIPTLNVGASAILTIPVTVRATGNYVNTATITSAALADSNTGNNRATAARLPDSDGDGVFDNVDLDDDNDGIPDTLEDNCVKTSQIVNGNFSGSATSWASGYYTTPNTTGGLTFNGSTLEILADNAGSLYSGNVILANTVPVNLRAGVYYNFSSTLNIFSGTTNVNFAWVLLDSSNNIVQTIQTYKTLAGGVGDVQITNTATAYPVTFFATGTGSYRLAMTWVTNSATSGNGQDVRIDDVTLLVPCNSDADSIPNYLDLDSDNDGCFDAVEGDENVIPGQLNADGSINTSTTGGIGTTVGTNNGVPNLVNSGGLADVGGDIGQGIGDSQSNTSNTQCSDTDGDGIPDNIDLDDDNDGILDTVEDACAFEGSPVYSNTFTTGARTSDVNVLNHTYAATGTITDGSYSVTTSTDAVNPYSQTDATGNLDAGNPVITAGSTTGRYLMINMGGNLANQVVYRVSNMPVTAGVRYRFRIDMVGLAVGAAAVPNLQLSLKDAGGTLLASANSGAIGMANDDIWRRLPLEFVATTTGNVTLEIVNLQPSTSGNDLGIDNIILAPYFICDTDGDGIPNSRDLDSDGDGCTDAIEGGATFTNANLVSATGTLATQVPTQNLGNTVGNTPTTMGVPTLAGAGQAVGQSQDSEKNDCLDTDADGIPNWQDLDDDNDGILDTAEDTCNTEGATVYSNNFGTGARAADPNVLSHTFVASGSIGDGFYAVTTSALAVETYSQTDLTGGKDAGDLVITNGSTAGRYLMININSPGTFNQPIYRVSNLSTVIGNRYRFRIDMVGLVNNTGAVPSLSLTIKDTNGNVLAKTNSANIGMANDDVWRRLALNFTATTTAVVLEIVNLQIDGGGNDIGIDNIVLAPVLICDADGDGIPNSQDLDSDGDGCTDAIEGGANFTNANLVASTGTISTQIPNQNLGNTVGNTTTTIGVPTIAGTGQTVGQSQDASKNDCIDSDGDTVPDWQDLDDDNDGILDLVECPNVYIVRPVVTSSITTTSTITNGNIQTIANAEGAGGTGSGAVPHWYTNAASNLPVIVNMNLQAASTIDNIKLYGPWGFDEWIKDFKIEFYNSSNALLGTEYLTAPNQYAAGGIILGFSKEYLNVSSVRFTIISDQGYSTIIPRRVSLSELVFLDLQVCDTDGDGIPNRLDLDSDGDGCTDAIEGGANFTTANLVAATGTIATQTPNQNLGNTVGNTVTTIGVPTIAGTGQAIGQSQDGSKNDCVDTDADGIPDWQDLDDDNDGILDTVECPTTLNDFITAYSAGTTTNIVPSDFQLALNVKNQNVTRDLSAKFGYPANSGAVIVSITNASVHPTQNVWWTKNGEQPSRWKITGTMSAYVLMGNDFLYYANDSKTIHIYDNADVIPVTVPGFANQTAVAGQWSVSETQSQKTLSNLDANSGTTENANWRYINMNIGPKSFGFSTTVAFADPNYAVVVLLECDTDKDGIPDRLDLDSDNDGCFDALEGDENVVLSQLNANGSINTTTTGGLGNVSTNLGVPNLVNSGGAADIGGDIGQGVGDSQNALISSCYCYKKPVLNAGTTIPVQHGITSLTRAGGGATEWPTVRQSAWTVLEANTKGFVVNKVAFEDADNNATTPTTPVGISVGNYVEGMMVYDTVANCLKIYNGTFWNCYSTQTCPQ